MKQYSQSLGGLVVLSACAMAPCLALAEDDQCLLLAAAEFEGVTINAASLQLPGEPIEGATLADASGTPSLNPVSSLPAFCRVVGSAQPEDGSDVRFEVWLPRDEWTGNYTGGSNGGFAGYISYADLAAAVAAGNAGASTNTGHVGMTDTDSAWAVGHPERVRDYGWRGIHVTTLIAKQLMAAYYGRGPDHSYFLGCSNGGRQGLMEAWRYPEDYDGIIAGAPAARFTTLVTGFIGTVQAQLPEGAAFNTDQMTLVQAEVLKQCDALDGQVDGLIMAPRRCRLDTEPLACGSDNASGCFSAPQLDALDAIIAGRRDRYGRPIAMGYSPSGAEAGPLGWGVWFAAGQGTPTPHGIFARGLLQDLMQEPTATPETFDFDSDLRALEAALGPDLNVEPQLQRYFARGGKLILWQGWADGGVPANLTLAFHRALVRNAGALASDALRLFMVPGVQHCSGGTGPDVLGQMGAPPPGAAPERSLGAALSAWVERGRTPDRVIGGFSSEPASGREGLVCAYPKLATLRTGEDPSKAASYDCRD